MWLAGGMRQRCALVRTLMFEHELVLLDEPLSNLDAKLRVQMRAEISALHNRLQATMIYVTHDQVEAMTMADKIVVLNAGNVAQVGSPLELYSSPDNLFVAGFIGSPKMNFVEGDPAMPFPELVDALYMVHEMATTEAIMPLETCRGGQAALGGDHGGRAARHRLHRGHPERLVPAAQGEDVGEAVVVRQLVVLERSAQLDPGLDAQGPRAPGQAPGLVALRAPGDAEARVAGLLSPPERLGERHKPPVAGTVLSLDLASGQPVGQSVEVNSEGGKDPYRLLIPVSRDTGPDFFRADVQPSGMKIDLLQNIQSWYIHR